MHTSSNKLNKINTESQLYVLVILSEVVRHRIVVGGGGKQMQHFNTNWTTNGCHVQYLAHALV